MKFESKYSYFYRVFIWSTSTIFNTVMSICVVPFNGQCLKALSALNSPGSNPSYLERRGRNTWKQTVTLGLKVKKKINRGNIRRGNSPSVDAWMCTRSCRWKKAVDCTWTDLVIVMLPQLQPSHAIHGERSQRPDCKHETWDFCMCLQWATAHTPYNNILESHRVWDFCPFFDLQAFLCFQWD